MKEHSDEHIAIVEITGRPNIVEIQQQLMDSVNYIKEENLKYAILDCKQMEGMFTLSLYWYRMRWLPLAKESGLKFLAIVLPNFFVPVAQLERLNDSGSKLKAIKFRFFVDQNDAKEWISELN